ncbi:pentatricopeptide repeat-containing protein [Tanacetum coccineum]
MQNVGVGPDCFTLPHVPKPCGGSGALIVGRAVHGQVFTFVSVISAYADIEDFGRGKSFHSCMINMGLEFKPELRIDLTTLYAKCGEVMIAKSLFDEMEISNVIMWNAMISGFAKNGCCNEAIALFQIMLSKNLSPDSVTICSTILACVQLGHYVFVIKRYGGGGGVWRGKWGSLVAESGEGGGWEEEVRWCDGGGRN